MEGHCKNLGTPRSPSEVVRAATANEGSDDSSGVIYDIAYDDADSESEFFSEEPTSPGVVDPEVRNALASLRRVQAGVTQHASDVEAELVRRKTPYPPRQ
jgi:hypothetical protein